MAEDWSGEVAITGMGLVTPVGLNARIALAAMRAGISRLKELPYLEIEVNEEELGPVIGAEIPAIASGHLGVRRLCDFVTHSIADAISDARLENGTSAEVFLGTAGDRPAERVANQTEDLRAALTAAVPAALQVRAIEILSAGRAAALQALRRAAERISSGAAEVAIAGGVDSWSDPRSLQWLRVKGLLREFPRRTGVLPGEAGGFLVLESRQRAQARRARIKALLTAAAGRTDATPAGEPRKGDALAAAVRAAGRGVNDPHALVISDFNGERYRALEWMLAIPKGMWRYETLRHWHPAEYIGDSGAASGAVTAAWAAEALARRYAKTPHVLVWGASDEGAREALLVTAGAGA